MSVTIEHLAETDLTKRDRQLFDMKEDMIIDWYTLTTTHNDSEVEFYVVSDAVYLPTDSGRFRFPVSVESAKPLAEFFGALFCTTKVMDLAYAKADVVLNAVALGATPDMAHTTKCKEFNRRLEILRAGRQGLIRDVGKAWVLTASGTPTNYGFYDKNAPNIGPGKFRMWQTPGHKHDSKHQDYSQTLFLMKRTCIVNGIEREVKEVLADEDLYGALSYELIA